MKTKKRVFNFAVSFFLCAVSASVCAGSEGVGDGLHNIALTTLGATAKGSVRPFNKDWPAQNALLPGGRRGGTIFGAPLKDARIDIKLLTKADIKAMAVTQLDYRGTKCPSSIDVYFDGEKVKTVEIPHQPGKRFQFPVEGENVGSVSVVVTGEYPNEIRPDGKKGPDWGGWERIEVLSETDFEAYMIPPDDYSVKPVVDSIAVTDDAVSGKETKVYGEPRVSKGHPCTIWDSEDVQHYRSMMKTSTVLAEQVEAMCRGLDERMNEPVGVPPPRKNDKGEWVHVSDRETGTVHNRLAVDTANLGAAYALTGEEKYAEFAKKILLAYADVFDKYAPGNRPGFSHDAGKCFDQRLSDAIWLIQLVRGYDLIYNMPGMTEEERRHIEEDLLIASAEFIKANRHVLGAGTNWAAICTAAVLITGYATGREDLVNTAMYGVNGTAEKPTGGVILQFSEKSISDDGMWAEGAMGYQFMAMQALITEAEILWHHGVDMYRYRNGVLKRLFDSPIRFAYPNLATPAIHDSNSTSIIGRESYLYEFGYRRYRDPRYLDILNRISMHIATQYQQWPVSVLYDRDFEAEAEPSEWESVNFFSVGYGILRSTAGESGTSLLLDYGPNRSHGHPDKLNIDLWALNRRLVPDPGMVWYEQPLYRSWYSTTVAHNTLCVDELNQANTGAELLTYCPGISFGFQRGRTDTAYSGVTMDRSLFLTPEYAGDIFGAFARLPRVMDLAWHIVGDFETDAGMSQFQFSQPLNPGYSQLANASSINADNCWMASFTQDDGKKALFFNANSKNDRTEIIVADGILHMQKPKTVLLRKRTKEAVFGSVLDFSEADGGFVRNVEKRGGLRCGWAALEITTETGSDICYAAFDNEAHEACSIKTDAVQAFLRRTGGSIGAAYICGGTFIGTEGFAMSRSSCGLLGFEKVGNGSYVLSNPSVSNTAVKVEFPSLQGRIVYSIDTDGVRSGVCRSMKNPGNGVFEIELEAGSSVEFAVEGSMDVHDFRKSILQERKAAAEAAEREQKEAFMTRERERLEFASENPVPAGFSEVVQAEDFKLQGGDGAVLTMDNKVGASGKSICKWDNMGHWLEWEVGVPSDGCYNITLCYCAESAAERRLTVNGEEQEPLAVWNLEASGGWSNNSDDWKLATLPNPYTGKPLLVKLCKGINKLRLTNTGGGGSNLDYIIISSPDVVPAREMAGSSAK